MVYNTPDREGCVTGKLWRQAMLAFVGRFFVEFGCCFDVRRHIRICMAENIGGQRQPSRSTRGSKQMHDSCVVGRNIYSPHCRCGISRYFGDVRRREALMR